MEYIILEIIKVRFSTFYWKFSKFHAHIRTEIKNLENVFCLWDNGVWICVKVCKLQRECLLSAVNDLKNSLKITTQTNKDFFQFNISKIQRCFWKNKIIVVPCWFQQCLETVKALFTEWCSEARSFRRLSNELFRSI